MAWISRLKKAASMPSSSWEPRPGAAATSVTSLPLEAASPAIASPPCRLMCAETSTRAFEGRTGFDMSVSVMEVLLWEAIDSERGPHPTSIRRPPI
ncbi:hypothetical protein FQZ97_591680 [compost metagenome]